MRFKQAFHAGLIDGSITLTFRRWSRPRVRIGGRYRVNATAVLEVTALDEVRMDSITDEQAQLSGFSDVPALLSELERESRMTLGPASTVHRVSFRYLPLPDERERLALDADVSAEDAAALAAQLERMDARSRHGPWTKETLFLIERHPGTAASRLAKDAGRETQAFKADVRKLKKLGLTLSHDVGYELSPRGRAFVERTKR